MCGIGGYINSGPIEGNDIAHSLISSLKHRGPDSNGSYIEKNMCLAHTRLSIIDTSEAGNQPFYSVDKNFVLICNGEIYNFQELRLELISKGYNFQSNSDSEVILHLYKDLDGDIEALLNRLNGMFAFALWDKSKKQLILVRDRFGIKPLYYFHSEDEFSFASEVLPIKEVINTELSIDNESVYEYLRFLSIPEPNTIYKEIKSLGAGEYAVYQRGNLTVTKWYDLANKNRADAGNSFLKELEEITKEHLVADVPVGTFLSGGIDSSVITYLSSKYKKEITTITASFPKSKEDETPEALESAQLFGLKSKVLIIQDDFFKNSTEIISKMDQPFGVQSAFSLYGISKLAKEEVKVVLSGDGGDEILAGYDHKFRKKILPYNLNKLSKKSQRILGSVFSKIPSNKLKSLGRILLESPVDKFLSSTEVAASEEARRLIKSTNEVNDRFEKACNKAYQRAQRFDSLRRINYLEFNSFLKSEMLYKVDRMTMLAGIEARVPFLDHRVVEHAFSLPSSQLRDDKWGKIVLRQFLEKVGLKIAWREKTGFNSPIYSKLQSNLYPELEKAVDFLPDTVFKMDEVKKKMVDFRNGNLQLGAQMFSLYVMGNWFKIHG